VLERQSTLAAAVLALGLYVRSLVTPTRNPKLTTTTVVPLVQKAEAVADRAAAVERAFPPPVSA
jgi:hypothetical protein